MTSTQTFGDKLRSLIPVKENRNVELAEAFWTDIKLNLEELSRQGHRDVTIKIAKLLTSTLFIMINGKDFLTPNLDGLYKKYNPISIILLTESGNYRFGNIDFQHFENLVKGDGCTYTYLDSCTFKISW